MKRWLATLFGCWFIWSGGILWGHGDFYWFDALLGIIGVALVWAGYEK